ncbi:5699_t:CDS:2 [Acaulospora morrowiae]|uniref:5699_t:CDS:1 n=1 Tax=Acaulospora morrowiae TaxID=94023 RepID=A0A9N8ZIW8_9GLOM|nr:5699_t:CDS:2 [Acaulospora morrowiae]
MASAKIKAASSQFLQLSSSISEIEWVEKQLPSQTEYYEDLQKKVQTKRDDLEKIRKKIKEFEGINFAIKKLFATLTFQNEEMNYSTIFEKGQEEKALLTKLENELDEATQTNKMLFSKKQQLDTLRSKLYQLYDSVFTGITPEFPSEDALEEEANSLYAQFNQVDSDLNRYKKAIEYIESAKPKLHEAIECLRNALKYNSWDLFSNSTIANFFEFKALKDARNYSKQTQEQIDKAKQCIPEASRVGELNLTQEKFVSNFMYDNLFMDIHIRSKIEGSLNKHSEYSRDLDNVHVWLQENVTKLTKIYSQMHEAFFKKRQELMNERKRIFESVLGISNHTSTSSSLPLPTAPPFESFKHEDESFSSDYAETSGASIRYNNILGIDPTNNNFLESHNDHDETLPSYDEAVRQSSFDIK